MIFRAESRWVLRVPVRKFVKSDFDQIPFRSRPAQGRVARISGRSWLACPWAIFAELQEFLPPEPVRR